MKKKSRCDLARKEQYALIRDFFIRLWVIFI